MMAQTLQVYALPYNDDGDIELYYMKVYSSDAILQFTKRRNLQTLRAHKILEPLRILKMLSLTRNLLKLFLPYTLTHAYSVSGANTETQIAPDWSIITNGTGTVTVTQIPVTDITMPTSAPFALRISSSGITSSYILRQTISESPRRCSEMVSKVCSCMAR